MRTMAQHFSRIAHLPAAFFYIFVLTVLGLVTVALGFILHRIFHRWARRLQGSRGEAVRDVLESLILPLLVLAALYSAVDILSLPPKYEHFISKAAFTFVIGIVFYSTSRMTVLLLRRAARRDPPLVRVTEPAAFFVRVTFGFLALIIVLENLGVSLTAVWTTLGVGSVAVGLALQATLGNFFAGISLIASRPFSTGDRVKLSSGAEGEVVRIGWYTTRLRTDSNDVVFVPNSVMTTTVFTNLSLPSLAAAHSILSIPVKVNYHSDPDRVENTLVNVVQETAPQCKGLLLDPPPRAFLTSGMGDASMEFSLVIHVGESADREKIKHELGKRILRRYQSGEIQLPSGG